MENDDKESFFELKKNKENYLITYDDKQYLMCNHNITCQDGELFNTELEDDVSFSINFQCNNPFAIKIALEALTFENYSKILEHFFKIDNDHFYDLYNFYSVLTPSNTFKTYFYSIMILKESLQHSNIFNIKAYILTLDESKLFTSHYHAQKNDRTNRLNKINSIEKNKRDIQMEKELAQLTKLQNKDTALVHLISEYIANTFLDKKRQQIEYLQNPVLNDMVKNGMYEKDLLTIK